MACPHPPGELLLGQPELAATHDHEPRDPLVRRQTLLRSAVPRITTTPTLSGVSRRGSDRAPCASAHGLSLPILISNASAGIKERRDPPRVEVAAAPRPCGS